MLTDHDIRLWRAQLAIEISRLQRERYDCVLALGGDALNEDQEPRDAAARQRIYEAINARCQGCHITLTDGPTTRDLERFVARVCGACEQVRTAESRS